MVKLKQSIKLKIINIFMVVGSVMQGSKIYSLDPVIDSNSRVLILGTMPGVESLSKGQYYANERNQFWHIMSSVLNIEFPNDYPRKINILKNHKIALWDVIHVCERVGSLDSNIKYEEPNDIESLLKNYPTIKLIVFNGSKAFKVFKKHIGFKLFSRVDFERLPSTSATPGKNVKTFEEKVEDWSIIKNYIS